MALKVQVDDGQLRREQVRVGRRLDDARPPLVKFHAYMLGRTGRTFRALGRGGGRFRGVSWADWANQYTRRTDGVTVPAHGGVAKVRGRGRVKGRRRASGARVTPGAMLLRDTGRLAAAAGTTRRWGRGGKSLYMTTANVAYGRYQQAMRPFLFFQLPKDAQVAQRLVIEHLDR